jgi:hypothetical protein
VFDTKESFDKYISNDMYEMIWEYLQITAEGVGITVTFEDGEVDLV